MALDEGAVVHLVDVIAGQDDHQLGVAVGDVLQVLQHRVSRAAVPLPRSAAAQVWLEQRHAAAAAVEVPGTPDADVVDQRARRVLGQDRDVGEARVDRVAEGEVDDPVLAAEGDPGLGADLRQDREPLTLATGEDQGQDRLRHGLILARSRASARRATRRAAAGGWLSGVLSAASPNVRPGPGGARRPGSPARRRRSPRPRAATVGRSRAAARARATACSRASRARSGTTPGKPPPADALADADGSGVGVARISPQIGPPKPLLPFSGAIRSHTASGPSSPILPAFPLGPSWPLT